MQKTYSTDRVMIQLFQTLCSDFKRCTGMNALPAYCASVEQSRARRLLVHDNMDAYTYKWTTQIASFLKRYTFQNDVIQPQEREELTNVKFIELQESLAGIYGRRRSLRLHKVLCRARTHARRILSGFPPKDLYAWGQFGTKATVGCSASQAYIDTKLLQTPITGSALHLQWFTNDYLEGDELLSSIIRHREMTVVGELSQVNVPKKYNIDRGINPNTLIGSLYSSALGRIVQEALLNEGLDIRRLQSLHATMMRVASHRWKETGYIPFATADLSNASHGFLSHHLNALLPREWYRACMRGVIRQVEVGQRHLRLESIMTMGIGFTFPMQTLLFYCLLLSIQDLSQIKGRISVYGDDLIYPVRMHRFVATIFTEMGFQLNLDKTFVKSPFRESCGSDWFKGVDVRPFSPEGQSQLLGRTQYAAFCYKLLNGLQRRWHESEVSSSVLLLKFCITSALGSLFIVPEHFPDFSGYKSPHPEDLIVQETNAGLFPVVPSTFQGGDGTLWNRFFTSLVSTPRRRYVVDHAPYYWDWLRSHTITCDPEADASIPKVSTPTFLWAKKRHDKRFIIISGKKVIRRYAYVALKDPGAVARYEVSLVHVCSPHTEERELT